MVLKRWAASVCVLAACGSEESTEAERVSLPVRCDGARLGVITTDLGYSVELDRWRVAARDLELTIKGETHASVLERLLGLVVGTAHAHPGHLAGGEVTGELAGDFVLDWAPGSSSSLGEATLIAGTYEGANFHFRRATVTDGLVAGDPLLGHTIAVTGTVRRGEDTWALDVVLDLDDGAAIIGVPFAAEVGASSAPTIALEATPNDPYGDATVFDGVDLATLDPDGDGRITIRPGEGAANALRRSFGRHDFYFIEGDEE